MKEGRIDGPEILSCGQAIYKKGRYGSFLGPGVSSLDEARQMIDSMCEQGVDWIKILVSGIVSFKEFGNVGFVQFSQTEINCLVDYAHSLGVPVMAHASSDEAVVLALNAGVDSVEHGYFLSTGSLKVMAERNIPWVPTVAPVANQVVPPVSFYHVEATRSVISRLIDSSFVSSGFFHLTIGQLVMWSIAFGLMYLAIKKQYEPLLLLPIAFGILVVNLPLTFLMEPGSGLIWRFYHYGIDWEIIPPLIFLGLGALTDFGPLIANPKTLLLGGGAQAGVYLTYFAALLVGFDMKEAASIAIIGGADGPTTIFLTSKLAPQLLGPVAVAAYSYMALVPIVQPPVMRLLTTEKERQIVMRKLRPVSKLEKIVFPVVTAMVIMLIVPASAALMAMFMMGNLFKESGVVERLTKASQNN